MIVVGVDGSTSSRDAIRWAVDEARLRKTKVEAVYAWQSPLVVGFQYIPAGLLDPEALDGHAQEIVDAAVAEVGETRDVEIESRAIEGVPARVLLTESRDADMSCSAHAVAADSQSSCWVPSVSNASTTPPVRS